MDVQPDATAEGPLRGIRVVDFTHVISGPFASQTLGDLGASVIKIEGVEHGDVGRDMGPDKNGQSHYFVAFNRNKRSIALDLKSDAGRQVALALLAKADVVIENFAPGAIGRLGLGYDVVKAANPSVVYCSISGFGQTGPLAHKRSFDLIAQAYSGIMSTNGEPGEPPVKVGVPIGDTASSLFAVIGILAALFERKQTGAGRFIDVAMYDSLLTLLANYGGYFNATGEQPGRTGSGHYFTVPYGTFEAADGDIAITVMTDANWSGLCLALGLDDLGADPSLRSLHGRSADRVRIYGTLGPVLKQHTVAGLVELLGKADVPCAPVNDIGSALGHAHTAARGMLLDLEHASYGHIQATSLPLRSVMRATHTAPPLRGEHTAEVLRGLGMTEEKIIELLAQKDAWQHHAEGAPLAQGELVK